MEAVFFYGGILPGLAFPALLVRAIRKTDEKRVQTDTVLSCAALFPCVTAIFVWAAL